MLVLVSAERVVYRIKLKSATKIRGMPAIFVLSDFFIFIFWCFRGTNFWMRLLILVTFWKQHFMQCCLKYLFLCFLKKIAVFFSFFFRSSNMVLPFYENFLLLRRIFIEISLFILLCFFSSVIFALLIQEYLDNCPYKRPIAYCTVKRIVFSILEGVIRMRILPVFLIFFSVVLLPLKAA